LGSLIQHILINCARISGHSLGISGVNPWSLITQHTQYTTHVVWAHVMCKHSQQKSISQWERENENMYVCIDSIQTEREGKSPFKQLRENVVTNKCECVDSLSFILKHILCVYIRERIKLKIQNWNSPNENCNLIWIFVNVRFTSSHNFIHKCILIRFIHTSAIKH
jgi:hypothetical protein